MFVGGGRSNLFLNNQCIRCGTVFYLNNQGMFGEFDNPTVNCTDLRPPFVTTCSTGAAEWMITQSPAADVWATTWPEMQTIRSDYLGYPAHTQLINSTYCCSNDADICEMLSSNTDISKTRTRHLKNRCRVTKCRECHERGDNAGAKMCFPDRSGKGTRDGTHCTPHPIGGQNAYVL